MTDVSTALNSLWTDRCHLHQERSDLLVLALTWQQMGKSRAGLTRIHDADIVCDVEGGAHVRSPTTCGGALCSRPRASFIATASRPIDGADLATAACQVRCDPWAWQWRGFRHAPPRRSVE